MSALLISQIVLILTDESTANNCQSLLLKLPREIQDQICKLVCGGNLLHFKLLENLREPQRRLCHVECRSKITEDDAQASFYASKSPWFDEVCANRHEECWSSNFFCDESGRTRCWPTLDLRFLRTCRQIYDVAKNLCYSTNMFSFDSLDLLIMFGKRVRWVSHIRSLRLHIRSGNRGSGPVFPERLKQILRKLTGVRWIHIELEQIFVDGSRTYNKRVEEDSLFTKQLLYLGGTALKLAAVVISDARFCNYSALERTQVPRNDAESQMRRRWTMREKQEYAHFLQNALLEHRGKGLEGDMDDSGLF